MSRRAILMDRDGTINEEVGFMERVESLRLLPRAAEAIRAVNAAGFQAVVVTNQSGVARGILDENRVSEAHERLRELLDGHGARLDGIYHCPHHPEHGGRRYRRRCECRKPGPGMLIRARDQMGVDLEASYVIGDRPSDLLAGLAVGATPLLVLTGVGRRSLAEIERLDGGRPAHVAADLFAAVSWILEHEGATAQPRFPPANAP